MAVAADALSHGNGVAVAVRVGSGANFCADPDGGAKAGKRDALIAGGGGVAFATDRLTRSRTDPYYVAHATDATHADGRYADADVSNGNADGQHAFTNGGTSRTDANGATVLPTMWCQGFIERSLLLPLWYCIAVDVRERVAQSPSKFGSATSV